MVCQRRHQDRQWRRMEGGAEWGAGRGEQGRGAQGLMGQRWHRGADGQGVPCCRLGKLLCPWRKEERAMRGRVLGHCQHQGRVLEGSWRKVRGRRSARGEEEAGAGRMKRRRLLQRRVKSWVGGWEALASGWRHQWGGLYPCWRVYLVFCQWNSEPVGQRTRRRCLSRGGEGVRCLTQGVRGCMRVEVQVRH